MSPHPSLSTVLVSLATPVFLGGILSRNLYSEIAEVLGQASLELFRGERLPLLNVSLTPPSPDAAASQDAS